MKKQALLDRFRQADLARIRDFLWTQWEVARPAPGCLRAERQRLLPVDRKWLRKTDAASDRDTNGEAHPPQRMGLSAACGGRLGAGRVRAVRGR